MLVITWNVLYFLESHRKGIDLNNTSITKLDQEVQKKEEKKDNDDPYSNSRNPRY